MVLEPLGPEHVDGLRAAAADERIWPGCVRATSSLDRGRAAAADGSPALRRAPRRRVVVGSTSYLALAPEHRRLEIGNTWLNPSAWGTGANIEAKYLSAPARVRGARLRCGSSSRRTRSTSAPAAALAATPLRVRGNPPQSHARPRRRAARLGLVRRDRRRLARGAAGARSPALGLDLPTPGIRYGTGASMVEERQRHRSRPRRLGDSPPVSRSAASSCARTDAELALLCVPDAAIRDVAQGLSPGHGVDRTRQRARRRSRRSTRTSGASRSTRCRRSRAREDPSSSTAPGPRSRPRPTRRAS